MNREKAVVLFNFLAFCCFSVMANIASGWIGYWIHVTWDTHLTADTNPLFSCVFPFAFFTYILCRRAAKSENVLELSRKYAQPFVQYTAVLLMLFGLALFMSIAMD